MKIFILLALAMLICFSTESKLRSASKSKQLNTWYINIPIYIPSYTGKYLIATNRYELDVEKKKSTVWRIKLVKGAYDKYNVIANDVDYLCLQGLFDSPTVCRNADKKSEWSLSTSGSDQVGLRGYDGNYLCDGTFDITTSRRMQKKETWNITKA